MIKFQPTAGNAVLAAATAALIALALYGFVVHGQANRARSLALEAQARATAFEAQARLSATSAEIGETRARNTAEAVRRAKEAEDDIEQAPDLDGAVAAYRRGIDGVRAPAGAGPDAQLDGRGPNPGR